MHNSKEDLFIGQMIPNMEIKRSNRDPNDGISYYDSMVVIVKNAKLKEYQTICAGLKIESIKENCIFASMI